MRSSTDAIPFSRETIYPLAMRNERAKRTLLRILCTLAVLTSSIVLTLPSVSHAARFASASTSAHNHLSNHVGRTLPHEHDADSSHSHAHGVPAPDSATPSTKDFSSPHGGLVATICWEAFLIVRQRISSQREDSSARNSILEEPRKSFSPGDSVKALIFASQAPPLSVA